MEHASAQEPVHMMDALRSGDPSVLSIVESLQTHRADGRKPILELYSAQSQLVEDFQWKTFEAFTETLTTPDGHPVLLPVNCLATRKTGPALWIITGIHGEEPAGPNALVCHVRKVIELEKAGVPMVVLPLCNPLGYCKSWRYPDAEKYSEANPGRSVGDSDHWLLDKAGHARSPRPSSRQCEALTRTVLELARTHPPLVSLDFHEDDTLERGYLYSQGPAGTNDRVGRRIVAELLRRRFPIMENGETRFHETIRGGMIADVHDGSIDELLGATKIARDGSFDQGPGGRTVLVIETGSRGMALPERIAGHGHVLSILGELWEIAGA